MRNFICLDNFLPDEVFWYLKESFPIKWGDSVRSHKDIYCTDEVFKDLSPVWQILYEHIHTEKFWDKCCKYLNVKPPVNFRPEYREPRDGVATITTEVFTYARCDIGLGLAGYGLLNGGRGVHIDNTQRIISGLLYFTDQSDLEGGEFDVCESDGSLVERIPLACNRAVLSVQNNEGWHRVNPLIRGERRAVYFALSSSIKVWNR